MLRSKCLDMLLAATVTVALAEALVAPLVQLTE